MPKVFISYSHKDEEWKDKLVTHLSVLEKEERLSFWTDRDIQAGDDWFPEIEKAIESAQVAILMISANFLSSDFILNEEIPRLLKKMKDGGMKVLPLIIKPCAWQEVKWLSQMQVRPKDGKALSTCTEPQVDTALTAFAKEVNDILKYLPEQTDKKITSYFLPDKIDLTKLPDTNAILFGRETELKILDKAWENPKTKIISLIAWGGVGKSALTNAWLNEMDLQNFKGAEQVYGWSFYSQGTKEDTQASADGFLNDALQWFGYEGDPPRSQHDKGRLLAAQIANKKTLLILDGLEPLQYPPGEMHGHLKDQAMIALLKGLARSMNGLCIITSRVEATDLKSTEGRMTLTHELENLGDDAGIQLLKSYQLKGPDEELKKASHEFKGHALALNLLGSYLKTVHDGDIRKSDLIPALMEEEKNGGHARRVMESYERWFAEGNKPELDILNLLGLFDRPADKEAIEVLKAEPTIPGLTDCLADLSFQKWKISLQRLRDLRLIAKKENNEKDCLDCHPLIREHFGEKLQQQNPNSWMEAHSRLYEYYNNKPKKELPDTLEEMEPLFAAVRHGCLAGKYQEAMDDVFWKRIYRRDEKYTIHKLGAYGSDLACLSAFFESPWERPVSCLTEGDKAAVLNWVGYALRAVGRLREAVQPMKAGLKMHIQQKNWKESAIDSNNLSELLLTLGDVKASQEYAKQSVDFADQSGDDFQMEVSRASLANTYFEAGNSQEAEVLFLEAENMQKKRLSKYTYLYSRSGFLYCELLISFGKYNNVLDRCRKLLEWRLPSDSLLDISIENISHGKAFLLQSLQNKSSDFSEASGFLNQAADGLREAGYQDDLPRGLFARASLFRHQDNFSSAWADLDEPKEIAEYGSMKLHLVNYYLEACRVVYVQLKVGSSQIDKFKMMENGEVLSLSRVEMEEKFRLFFAEAERLVNKCGYHRRDGELEELRVLGKAL